MRIVLALASIATIMHVQGQSPTSIPGPPPDEYVDVTGDGRADLLITSRTIRITDPQQPGYHGMYKVGVRTLSGNAVLMWSTPSNQRWFTLDSAERLDTAELSARIHFKQLSWTDEDRNTEFWLLERPFGPAITKEQDGWYGTGEHHNGHTMVLRSANDLGTSVAAFSFELPFPYGRVVVKEQEAVRVPNGYGEEGDPVPTRPIAKDGYDFGHEDPQPQVIVPPGVAPDEEIELTSDDIPDIIIASENAPYHSTAPPLGTYYRGVRMLPGAALLMEKRTDGHYSPFALKQEGTLTNEQLRTGLDDDRFRWAEPPRWREFISVLQQNYGSLRTAEEPEGWLPVDELPEGVFVFRATQFGRPMVGGFEMSYTVPGGELGVRLMGLVDEGQPLEIH